MNLDPVTFLQTVAEFSHRDAAAGQASSPQRRPRLATIDPAYVSGSPKVIFDGESTPSGKTYPRIAAYVPAANDRVLMIPVGKSYVIVGKVIP